MKKKLASLGLSSAILLGAAVSGYAATYVADTPLTGKSSESGRHGLGDGTRYLNANGKNDSGTVRVKKIVPYLPDSTVVSSTISSTDTISKKFTSVAKNADDIGQSYYIQWSGKTNASKVIANIKDTKDYE